MATKAGLFDGAMIALGQETLSDTGEDVKAGRVLNKVYDRVLADCLSMGSWNFAMETCKLDADTGVTPEFGHTEVFAKPTDWVRTMGVSLDENFSTPLIRYDDDVNYWSAGATPLYVRYVSNDTGLGLELSRWPPPFARYVELELASRIALIITEGTKAEEKIDEKRDKALTTALSQDAMNEAQPKFFPRGSWDKSRSGRSSRGDRGSRSNLIG